MDGAGNRPVIIGLRRADGATQEVPLRVLRRAGPWFFGPVPNGNTRAFPSSTTEPDFARRCLEPGLPAGRRGKTKGGSAERAQVMPQIFCRHAKMPSRKAGHELNRS